MKLDRLEKKTLKSEGVVKNAAGQHIPYTDSLGIWTIGHGSTRLFGQPVTMHTKPINDEMAMIQFRHDLYFAIKDASSFIDAFWTIGSVRQEALVEMAYQLGGPRQRKFTGMQKAANRRDWHRAALEMIFNVVEAETPSAWYQQTPDRCIELAEMIETNRHPWRSAV